MKPYQDNVVDIQTFLHLTYTQILKKIDRVIEIQKSMKRGKLPLPLVKM